METITAQFRMGRELLALRREFGSRGYFEVAREEARFAGVGIRTAQYLMEFAEACSRCGIRESDLEALSVLRLGSIRSRLKELVPPRTAALRKLREWSGETAREAAHKSRQATHPRFNDAVALVVRQADDGWSIAFAVERVRRNFDWQVLTGLTDLEARGFIVGVGWSAQAVWIQACGVPSPSSWLRGLRLLDVDTDLITSRRLTLGRRRAGLLSLSAAAPDDRRW